MFNDFAIDVLADDSTKSDCLLPDAPWIIIGININVKQLQLQQHETSTFNDSDYFCNSNKKCCWNPSGTVDQQQHHATFI
jgi:hypothetical protein